MFINPVVRDYYPHFAEEGNDMSLNYVFHLKVNTIV